MFEDKVTIDPEIAHGRPVITRKAILSACMLCVSTLTPGREVA